MTLKQLVKAAVGYSRYIILIEGENEEEEYTRVDMQKTVYAKYKDCTVDEFTTNRNTLNIYLLRRAGNDT